MLNLKKVTESHFNGKERLSRWTLFFLISLDIFVLTIIFYGRDFQTEVVHSPESQYNYSCQSFIDGEFNSTIYYYEDYSSDYYGDNLADRELDERCLNILNMAKSIKSDDELNGYKNVIEKSKNVKAGLSNDLYRIKSNYDTKLLEKIADSEIDEKVSDIQKKSKRLQALIKKEESLISKNLILYYDSSKVTELREYIDSIEDEVKEDYLSAKKYFYIKIYVIELLFTLPLVLIFYFMINRSLQRKEFLNYNLYRHLFFTSLIPLFITIFGVIVELLPKVFIEKLIEFFYNLEIPFFIYYTLIAIGVAVTFVVAKFIQERVNRKKDRNGIEFIESYKKSLCIDCGNRVDYKNMKFCPYCSNKLQSECKKCGELKISGMNYCQNCGE